LQTAPLSLYSTYTYGSTEAEISRASFNEGLIAQVTVFLDTKLLGNHPFLLIDVSYAPTCSNSLFCTVEVEMEMLDNNQLGD
jgi:hypothetical protein